MIGSILRVGWNRVSRNMRLIIVAWLFNLFFALIVVIPFSQQLDSTLPSTVDDERVAERIDETWFTMYQRSFQDRQTARLLDYSVLGGAPFIHHADAMVSGRTYDALAKFVWNLATNFQLTARDLGLITLLSLLSGIAGLFFAGGFISVYSSTVRASIPDLFAESARAFGRIFRLGFLGFVLAALLFGVANTWVSRWIDHYAMNQSTEWPMFVLLLLKSSAILFLLWFGGFILDYAKVRIVLEARTSALLAFWAGLNYCIRNWRVTVGVALILTAGSVVTMFVIGAFLESVHTTTRWTVLVVFVVQQVYLIIRQGFRAMTFASAVEVFRTNPARGAYPLRIDM
jgi:hypothetical protein